MRCEPGGDVTCSIGDRANEAGLQVAVFKQYPCVGRNLTEQKELTQLLKKVPRCRVNRAGGGSDECISGL